MGRLVYGASAAEIRMTDRELEALAYIVRALFAESVTPIWITGHSSDGFVRLLVGPSTGLFFDYDGAWATNLTADDYAHLHRHMDLFQKEREVSLSLLLPDGSEG